MCIMMNKALYLAQLHNQSLNGLSTVAGNVGWLQEMEWASVYTMLHMAWPNWELKMASIVTVKTV